MNYTNYNKEFLKKITFIIHLLIIIITLLFNFIYKKFIIIKIQYNWN